MPDPFGLKAGSTPPLGMADYLVSFHAVPKPHPAFQSYSGKWAPDRGLVQVIANSQIFEDEPDCRSSIALYERVKRQLEQVYGTPCSVEFLDDDPLWPDASDVWQSLNHGERSHGSRWDTETRTLDSNIERIDLMVVADEAYEASHVILAYSFLGAQDGGPGEEYGLEAL